MESTATDLLTKLAIAIITVLCIGLMGWFFKRWLSTSMDNFTTLIEGVKDHLTIQINAVETKQEAMNGSVKKVMGNHQKCREELPARFVALAAWLRRNDKVDNMIEKIFDKMDDLKDIMIKKREEENG
jgi:hypothetical protein